MNNLCCHGQRNGDWNDLFKKDDGLDCFKHDSIRDFIFMHVPLYALHRMAYLLPTVGFNIFYRKCFVDSEICKRY